MSRAQRGPPDGGGSADADCGRCGALRLHRDVGEGLVAALAERGDLNAELLHERDIEVRERRIAVVTNVASGAEGTPESAGD
jgi:hypothetical protein